LRQINNLLEATVEKMIFFYTPRGWIGIRPRIASRPRSTWCVYACATICEEQDQPVPFAVISRCTREAVNVKIS